MNNKFLKTGLIVIALLGFGVLSFAAPTTQNFTNIQPFLDSTYNNGAASLNWLNVYTKALTYSTTTSGCLQGTNGVTYFTGTNCGSGGGSGTVGSGTTGQFPYYAANGTTLTATSSLFISPTGKVGIGTNSPATLLDVNGTTSSLFYYGSNGSATAPTYSFTSFPNSGFYTGSGAMLVSVGGNQVGAFGSTGITAAGYGIQNATDALAGGLGLGSSGVINWQATYPTKDTGLSRGAAGKLYVGNGTQGDFTGTLIATQIGIGTTSPYKIFSVGGDAVIGAATAGGTLGDLYIPKLGTAAGTFIAVDAAGKVIATTSPSGGSGSPGGSNGQVQYNASGAFGGVATSTPTVSAPITYSGTLGSFVGGATGAFGCQVASGSQIGCLNALDWTAFNNKQATISVTTPITLTGASVGIVNQGTTAQVLHGNASGNASFGSIVNADIANSTIDLTAKVTGILPIANGGTATATQVTNGVNYYDGTHITSGTSLVYTGGSLGVGTSTPFATLSVNTVAGIDPLVIGSSTKTYFGVNQAGGIKLSELVPATSTVITYNWNNTPQLTTYQMGTSAFTINIVNATTTINAGSRKIIEVCNPGATAGAVTWTGVEWFGGTQPTQTTTSNQCDLYSFFVGSATSTTAYKVHGAMSAGFQ